MGKLIQGVGINDADYKLRIIIELPKVGGKRKRKVVWICPYYVKWMNMLLRSYGKSYQNNNPTYKGCTVCEEWLTFSNFKGWMITQDWEGKELDKDLLMEEGKVYSPETCVFVPKMVNYFLSGIKNNGSPCLLGVDWVKNKQRFRARCRNPFNTSGDIRREDLGLFDCELEAHFTWKKQKHIYSCELANSEYVTDERVMEVLFHKYKNYTVVENHLR